jgi:hypothetical protein
MHRRCANSALRHRVFTVFPPGRNAGFHHGELSRSIFAKIGARAVPSQYLGSTPSARVSSYYERVFGISG